MSNGPWTDEENDLTVADYFAMLADDISGRRYSCCVTERFAGSRKNPDEAGRNRMTPENQGLAGSLGIKGSRGAMSCSEAQTGRSDA